jgi:hypothetical protein
VRESLAVLAAVLIVGCGVTSPGSSSTPTPTSTPKSATASVPDACVLVTQAQASAIVGTDVTNQTGAAGAGTGTTTTCAYASSTTGAIVIVAAARIPTGSSQAALRQALFNQVSGLQAISGIGDSAGEAKSANNVSIAFSKGDTVVILQATSPTLSGDSMAPKLESLAKTVAGQV